MPWYTASENVMRVLRELKPGPSFWCRIRLHKWERWETKVTERDCYGDQVEHLRRECGTCGLPQRKKLKG